jgi:hypothetical protein
MPRPCSICSSEHRDEIERILVNRSAPYRNMAERYSVSLGAISRHVNEGHIAERLAKATAAEQSARADELLMDVRRIGVKTLRVLAAAEETEDWATVLRAVREARENIRLLAELRGRLDSRPVVNIIAHPEYVEARTLIVRALAPFSEARDAVVRALEAGGNGGG